MASEITMIPCTNQKALGKDLMDEIRAVYDAEKYGHITHATLMGVLEMLKLEVWEQSK